MGMKATIVCNRCGARRMGQDEEVVVDLAFAPGQLPAEGDTVLLMCWPAPVPNPVPGLRWVPCADCGVSVAVAPSSEWLLK